MDAFFASVEQLDNPSLKNKPVAVGGSGKRGVVAAASYEARAFGVRSAMPGFKARNLCPGLIFVQPRFDRYKEISSKIRALYENYTDLIEPLSLDEAYLDVTENKKNWDSAIKIALHIKKEIKEEIGLTASAGVSINKFLAKIASDIKKPDGLTVILPDEVDSFLEALPIEKFYGVGKATQKKMYELGIENGLDLKKVSLEEMLEQFGKMGKYYYDVVRGVDHRSVSPERIRKSISSEQTYIEDLKDKEEIFDALYRLSKDVHQAMQKREINGRTVNLKIRFSDFTTFTRSKTHNHFFNSLDLIFDTSKELIIGMEGSLEPVRLLGVGMSNLDTEINAKQLDLDLS